MTTAAEPNTTNLVDQPSASPRADSAADQFMRRLLRLPEGRSSTAAEARSAFQKSLVFTAARCGLMYIIFPFVLPLLGIAGGVGPVISILVRVVAMVSIVYSIRRFWRADHSKRWHYTIFGTVIICFLIWLTVTDTLELLT